MLILLNRQTKEEMKKVSSDDGDLEFDAFKDGFDLAITSIKELFSKENIDRLEKEIEEQKRRLREEMEL